MIQLSKGAVRKMLQQENLPPFQVQVLQTLSLQSSNPAYKVKFSDGNTQTYGFFTYDAATALEKYELPPFSVIKVTDYKHYESNKK